MTIILTLLVQKIQLWLYHNEWLQTHACTQRSRTHLWTLRTVFARTKQFIAIFVHPVKFDGLGKNSQFLSGMFWVSFRSKGASFSLNVLD